MLKLKNINNKANKKKVVKKMVDKEKKIIKQYIFVKSPYLKNNVIIKKFFNPNYIPNNKFKLKEKENQIKNYKSTLKLPKIIKSKSTSKKPKILLSKSLENNFKKRQKNNNNNNKIKYYVGRGNNRELIVNIWKKRQNWEETPHCLNINFRWQQTSNSLDFNKLFLNNKLSYNHFENHYIISDKNELYTHLKKIYSEEIWDFFPLTYVFDMDANNFFENINSFKKFFNENNKDIYNTKDINLSFIKTRKKIPSIKAINNYNDFNYKFKEKNNNIWVLKANNYNRGNGILIFKTINQWEEYLKKFYLGFYNNEFVDINEKNFLKSKKFMIQKYIEKPFLFDGRKFDIRVWVLITEEKKLYYYQDYYFRTSSNKFNLNDEDLFVHLTNNAIQKSNKEYGKYEEGNILSTEEFSNSNKNFDTNSLNLNIISVILKIFCNQINKKLFGLKYKNCFEIFGIDFMLDEIKKWYLIEINTNPCLEESNSYLKKIIPKMIKDTFEYTIDKTFDYNSFNENNRWVFLKNLK